MTTTTSSQPAVTSASNAMHNWFIGKVAYEKMLESGMNKKVTEAYLFDALSYTEAEARINEELKPFISNEFTISDIRRRNFSEIFFNPEGSYYYEIKVFFISLDEKSGAEKKTPVFYIAQASDIEDAIRVLRSGLKGTVEDYTIVNVKESPILDIFVWKKDEADTTTSKQTNTNTTKAEQ